MKPIASRSFKNAGLVLTLACTLASCQQEKVRTGKAPVDPRDAMAANLHPALHGTIGEFAVFADSAPLPVQGYGVVAELPHTGSGDMQPNIKAILTEQLYRADAGSYIHGTENISPERILASDEIAAVEVRGSIPPLARRGDRFDVVINTVANSQATSINNGLLWTSELKIIGFTADTGGDTHTIAFGRGPVFIPKLIDHIMEPGKADAAASQKALRSGTVIGGGIVGEDRQIRLQLFAASAGRSRAIERAINSRFPNSHEKIASADDDTYISLKIPQEFNSDPAGFVDVVKHMYLSQEVPGFSERKAQELIAAMADPKAPHRDLSLALQGLGRSILPDYLEPQFTSPNPKVRFWCGRAAAALQDVGGIVVLQDFIRDGASPFHDDAVKAIAEVSRNSDTMRATLSLLDLLKSDKTDERIEAYRGLLAIRSDAVQSYNLGRKLYLDVVPCDCPPLVVVSQTTSPRIALIGRPIVLAPETLYVSTDNFLTVSVPEAATPAADAGGANVVTASVVGQGDAAPGGESSGSKDNVVLYWRSPMGGAAVTMKTAPLLSHILSGLAYAPDPLAPGYDPKTVYIGASYQRLVEMLATLSKNQLMDAQFVMQKPSDLALTPTDLATNTRPEGLIHQAPPPVTPANPAMPDGPNSFGGFHAYSGQGTGPGPLGPTQGH